MMSLYEVCRKPYAEDKCVRVWAENPQEACYKLSWKRDDCVVNLVEEFSSGGGGSW